MKIGNREFDLENKAYIMGILNVTPDSFSDGGRWNDLDRAMAHIEDMIDQGMDILDLGGESTRPGHVQISDQEEIDRVLPVIRAIRKNFDVPISLDSYKGPVVREAVKEGVDLVNDVWGLKYDDELASVIAESGLPCCLMHNQPEISEDMTYRDYYKKVWKDLEETLVLAEKAGIAKEKIILDPGIGFKKTYDQNLALVRHFGYLKGLGYPLLLGTSRKGELGRATGLPVDQRVEVTAATTVIGVLEGASIFRVHDVRENKRAMDMAMALCAYNGPDKNDPFWEKAEW
ncbi:dihydropteroate synthase [Kallipyga gabonensis]|uniref:dihydropteroate synthase n=1 Tax=Kallipyga gabonensis TaxID=1686287 RepID=UPI0006B40A4B|nr:dihydropteroate synthase [Kallipyga gabonensis]